MKQSSKIIGLLFIFGFLYIYATTSMSEGAISKIYQGRELKASWETWYPYEYLENELVPTSLTGLDVELLMAMSKVAHQRIDFEPMHWENTLQALKEGTIDIATGATYSKGREDYVTYSKPYRYETDSLFVLRKKEDLYPFKTITEFQEFIKENKFRLGVIKGVLYADQGINDFINDPKNEKYIVYTNDEFDNLHQLLEHQIDGFIADRTAGSALIWQTKNGNFISEHSFNIKTPIHLIFSKKTVPDKIVLAFNKAIDSLHKNGDYENIVSWYLYPVILLQTIDSDWFLGIDVLGTLFFSISGVLIANSLNGSIFSAFIYAVLASIGGGMMRDIIFGQRPSDILATPLYIVIVFTTVLFGFLLIKIFKKKGNVVDSQKHHVYYHKIHNHLESILTICDALGLAAFTVTGVMISLSAKVEPLWLWGPFFAFITGAAGTIIRDILSKSAKISDIEGEVYSEVAIVWGLFLSIGLLYSAHGIHPEYIQNLVVITVVGAFLTRLFVYYYKVPNVYFK